VELRRAALQLKELYGAFEKIRELIPLGGYTPGMDTRTDRAVQIAPAIQRFLCQEVGEGADLADSQGRLQALIR